MTRDEIVDVVSAERRRRHVTQQHVSGEAGLTISAVSEIETKLYRSTHFRTLQQYVEALGFELIVVRAEEDAPPPVGRTE